MRFSRSGLRRKGTFTGCWHPRFYLPMAVPLRQGHRLIQNMIIASQIQFIPDLKNLGPRFPQSRKKDCNMSKLKTLVSMIYQDRVRVMNPQKLLAISFFRKSPWPEFHDQVPCLRKRKEHGVQKRTRSIRQPFLKMQESQSQNK